MKYRVDFTNGKTVYVETFGQANVQAEITKWNDTNYPVGGINSVTEVTSFPAIAPTASSIILTARQFFIALAGSGYVTQQEAILAAQTGAVPANIASVFASLPPEQALAAQITWAKMTTVSRNEPLITAVAAAMSLTEAEVDAFFIGASTL